MATAVTVFASHPEFRLPKLAAHTARRILRSYPPTTLHQPTKVQRLHQPHTLAERPVLVLKPRIRVNLYNVHTQHRTFERGLSLNSALVVAK